MRIVFIGTGEIGVPTLRALQKSEDELVGVVTQPDKPAGRDQKITAPPIKAALAGSKISILQPACRLFLIGDSRSPPWAEENAKLARLVQTGLAPAREN